MVAAAGCAAGVAPARDARFVGGGVAMVAGQCYATRTSRDHIRFDFGDARAPERLVRVEQSVLDRREGGLEVIDLTAEEAAAEHVASHRCSTWQVALSQVRERTRYGPPGRILWQVRLAIDCPLATGERVVGSVDWDGCR